MKTDDLMKIQSMGIEEKIAVLSVTDKTYVNGYVDRALFASEKNKMAANTFFIDCQAANKSTVLPRC